MEDHSWGNGAPIFYAVFNLKQKSTYKIITAIAVLGNSSIAYSAFQNNTVNISECVPPRETNGSMRINIIEMKSVLTLI